MNIKSIKLTNFKNHKHSLLEFGKNITLIYGPNESGKSTVLEALEQAFFESATSTKTDIENWITWGKSVKPEIEVVFTAGKNDYVLTRDFDTRNNFLKVVKNGDSETFKNKNDIERKLKKAFGFYNGDIFKTAVAISQAEVEIDNGDMDTVLQAITRTIFSHLKKQPDELLDDIAGSRKGRIPLLEKGTKMPAKQPGPIKSLQDEIDELEKERNELRAEVKEWSNYSEEARELDKKIQKKEKKLNKIREENRFLLTASKFLKKKVKLSEEIENEKKREKTLKDIEDADREKNRLRSELEKDKAALRKLIKTFNNLRDKELSNIEKRLEQLEQFSELNTKLEEAEKIKKKIARFQKDLQRLPPVERKIIDKALTLKTLTERKVPSAHFELTRKSPSYNLELSVDNQKKDTSDNKKISGMGSQNISLSSKDIEFKITLPSAEIAEELKKAEGKINNILKKYSVDSSNELEEIFNKREKIKKKLEHLKSQLNDKLADFPEINKLQEKVNIIEKNISEFNKKDLESRKENIKEKAAVLKSYGRELNSSSDLNELSREKLASYFDISKKELDSYLKVSEYAESLIQNIRRIKSKIESFDEKITDLEKKASPDGKERDLSLNIGEAKKDLNRINLELDASLEEINDIFDTNYSPTENPKHLLEEIEKLLEKHQRKAENLKESLYELKIRFTEANAHLKNLPDEEKIIEVEEELEYKRSELKKFKKELKILKAAEKVLKESISTFTENLISQISNKLNEYAHFLTDNKYSKIALYRERNKNNKIQTGILLIDSKTGQRASPQNLSKGAIDQIYLAARIAFSDLISTPESLPIILDDTFTSFDDKRLENAVRFLKRLKPKRQIIIMTCHKHIRDKFKESFDLKIVNL